MRLNCMANRSISIKKEIVKGRGGVVILDLEKCRAMKEMLERFQREEKLLRGLEKFENLTKWERAFVKKKKITQKQVLEND